MSDFESVKPYTQSELDQQEIWANEFDQWWESEGQYQRAGGGQYERSFARWAWLNREQNQQAIIDSLKAQINNMETCYIEKKKQVEDVLHILDGLYRKGLFEKPTAVSEAIKVLRGESDINLPR